VSLTSFSNAHLSRAKLKQTLLLRADLREAANIFATRALNSLSHNEMCMFPQIPSNEIPFPTFRSKRLFRGVDDNIATNRLSTETLN